MSELRTSRVINQGSASFDNITLDTNGSTRFGLADGGGGTPVLFVNKANNRVGINTASPTQALDIAGNLRVVGNAVVTGTINGQGNIDFDGDLNVAGNLDVEGFAQFAGGDGVTVNQSAAFNTAGTLQIRQDNSSAQVIQVRSGGDSNVISFLTADGWLRIDELSVATTAADNKLTVVGPSSTGLNTAGNVAEFAGPSRTNGFQIFVNDTNNNSGIQAKDADALILNPNGGRIGIGNDNPDSILAIASSSAQEIRLRQNGVASAVIGQDGGTAYLVGESGNPANRNVVIGTQPTAGGTTTSRIDIGSREVLITNTPNETDALYYLPNGKIHLSITNESGIDNWIDMAGPYQSVVGTGSFIRFRPTFQNVNGQTGFYLGGIATNIENTNLVWGTTTAGPTTSSRSTKTEYGRITQNGNFQIFNQTTSPINSSVTAPNFKIGANAWDTSSGSNPYYLEIGATASYAASWGYGRANIEFTIQSARASSPPRYNFMVAQWNGNVNFPQAISKGSGSFKIKHPLPEKKETQYLVHSFIEGPQADLIYRGYVDLEAGKATINIDEAARMSEGTFVLLCGNVSCFTSNESDWTAVKGSISGNILTIEAQDPTSTAKVSWMVVGERVDDHMLETDWTDENGRVITEPLTEAEEIRIASLENT